MKWICILLLMASSAKAQTLTLKQVDSLINVRINSRLLGIRSGDFDTTGGVLKLNPLRAMIWDSTGGRALQMADSAIRMINRQRTYLKQTP